MEKSLGKSVAIAGSGDKQEGNIMFIINLVGNYPWCNWFMGVKQIELKLSYNFPAFFAMDVFQGQIP